MLAITNRTAIPLSEIELTAVRSQGAGGQNVNKVATAIHLRFNIHTSSLPAFYQERLLKLRDNRITKDGIIVIKSQQHRTQEQNKQAALQRLQSLLQSVLATPKKRRWQQHRSQHWERGLNGRSRRGCWGGKPWCILRAAKLIAAIP